MNRVAVAVLALLPAQALAFDSKILGGADLHGRAAARAIYNAEHRPILQTAMGQAGLPSPTIWNQFSTLLVPTSDTTFADLTAQAWTLVPADPAAALRLRSRSFVPAQFAELPDFSYSLWDWLSGNELCPPDDGTMGVSGDDCYVFGGWMGSLNATHFPPQATWMWNRYHTLATQLGGVCQQHAAALGYTPNSAGPIPAYLTRTLDCGADGLCAGDQGYPGPDTGELDGIDDFLQQCQTFQLVLEAIAQHYLQDTWSGGHMWHRWGGAVPSAVINLERGLAVAMYSGIIHGAKAITTINDRQCAGTTFRYAWGAPTGPAATLPDTHPAYGSSPSLYEGVGDLFLPDLDAGGGWIFTAGLPRYWTTTYQQATMYDCLEKSVRDTYTAGAKIYGPTLGYGGTITNVMSEACHSQRATNLRMFQGSFLDVLATYFEFDNWAIWGLTYYQAINSFSNSVLLKGELNRIRSTLWLASIADPNGYDASTDTGTFRLGTFMGLQQNAAAANNVVPPYADPPLPWDGLDDAGNPDSKETVLLGALHRTLAAEHCTSTSRTDLNELRRRCQGTGSGVGLDATAREAACQLCEEFSARQIRIGCSESDYEVDREPLCASIADPDDVEFLYLDLNPTSANAQDAGLAAGEFCRDTTPSFGPCVNAYLFDDYDVAYCSTYYSPWIGYQCISCPACFPTSTALAIIDSPYDVSDLTIQWSVLGGGGYFVNPAAAQTTFVYDYLYPGYCGITLYGSASVELRVWDPYFSTYGIDFDSGQATCYASW